MMLKYGREFLFANPLIRLPLYRLGLVCLASAMMLCLLSCSGEKKQGIPEFLSGRYEGKQGVTLRSKTGFARYVFNKSSGPVKCSIEISKEGLVIGKLGNAVFQDASVLPNRNALERWLNLSTDYKITGRLISPVFDGDTVRERRVSIPFVCQGDSLSGSIFEGAGFEIYPLSGFELRRVLP